MTPYPTCVLKTNKKHVSAILVLLSAFCLCLLVNELNLHNKHLYRIPWKLTEINNSIPYRNSLNTINLVLCVAGDPRRSHRAGPRDEEAQSGPTPEDTAPLRPQCLPVCTTSRSYKSCKLCARAGSRTLRILAGTTLTAYAGLY